MPTRSVLFETVLAGKVGDGPGFPGGIMSFPLIGGLKWLFEG